MRTSRFLSLVLTMSAVLGSITYAQSTEPKLGKTGYFTLSHTTMVDNAVLPAGEYTVRHHDSASGHFMEFARRRSGRIAWHTVIAKVPCKIETRGSKVSKTAPQIIAVEGDMRLVSLEIRGENVTHIFAGMPQGANPGL